MIQRQFNKQFNKRFNKRFNSQSSHGFKKHSFFYRCFFGIGCICYALILSLLCSTVYAQSFYGFPSYEQSGQRFQPFAFFGTEPLWEDFQKYEAHEVYGQIGSATGQLETILEVDGRRLSGAYGCTATLISEDIIITNYHCVPNQESRIELVNAFLRMDFLTLGQSGDIYPVDIRVLESSEQLDYAILRVENSPGRIYGYVPLRYRSAVENEELFMVHHTKAKPKQITRRNCTLLKRSQLEQLPIEMVGEFRQFNTETDRPHRCDSEEGSSGALVFAYSDGAIVGLHFAGTSSQLPVQQRANIFVDIVALVEQSPQLRSLSQPIYAANDASSGLSNQISLATDSAGKTPMSRPDVTADSGFLSLVTNPQGADVYVNQDFLGKTPIEQFPLNKGRYDIRISHDGYNVVDGYFQIIAGQLTNDSIELVAQTQTGSQIQQGSQQGSQRVDGASNSQTGQSVQTGSSEESASSADARENFGSITVYSEPIGADVFVNDTLIGQTPLIAYALDLGVYDIRLTKDGFEDFNDRASIARSRNTDVTVRLAELESVDFSNTVNFAVPAEAQAASNEEPNATTQVGNQENSTPTIQDSSPISNTDSNTTDSNTEVESESNIETANSENATQTAPVALVSPSEDAQRFVSSATDFIRLAQLGGVLRLGEGSFDINAALSLNKDLEIIGAGAEKTIITSSTEGYVLKLNSMHFKASGVSFEHSGDRWANVVVAENSTVDLQEVSFSGAKWDGAMNQGGMGLWLLGSSSANITFSTFENNQLHGVYISDASQATLQRNLIQKNGQNGILFLQSSSGTASNNVIEDNGLHGISVGGEASPRLENNNLSQNGETGIMYFDAAKGTAFANVSEDNGSYGISVVGSAQPRIEQNTLRTNTKTGLFYAGESGGVATGNLISANSINGITINDSAQLVLTDNRIDGNFWYGVYFDGIASSSLENNIIENNQAGRSNR